MLLQGWSPSSRRAWIEIRTRASWRRTFSSPSSRRAWIETRLRGSFRSPAWVALLAEGVDRNHKGCSHARQSRVALLAEGVDRNSKGHRASRLIDRSPSSRRAWIEIWLSWFASAAMLVALLAEGVDRNSTSNPRTRPPHVALLAEGVDRNTCKQCGKLSYGVALLAEGVDRNLDKFPEEEQEETSPSSRRAWIEISCPSGHPIIIPVALLAEGVDRNNTHLEVRHLCMSRPPRGGCG